MLEWRDRMRAAGQPETLAVKHPSDWKPSAQREYLLDTTPDTRQPFARDWTLEETVDRRRKQVPNKAEGGMMRSPRDMHAELLVNGYDKGGMTGPAMEMSHELDNKMRRAVDYYDFGPRMDTSGATRISEYNPSPRERIAELGQGFWKRSAFVVRLHDVRRKQLLAALRARYPAGLVCWTQRRCFLRVQPWLWPPCTQQRPGTASVKASL
jgi:hypothetical protein